MKINNQDPICDRSRTVFVVTFFNFTLLWVSKTQTDISLCTLNSEYVTLSYSVRDLLPLKNLIKELIVKLVIYSEKLDFMYISTVYE